MLQPGERVQHLDLHLLGEAGGKALDVDLLRVQTHRLQKELVALLVRERHDLRLDARAVARPHALDHAGVDRAAVEIFADDRVRAFVRVGQPAGDAVFGRVLRLEAERFDLLVAGLHLQFGEVHGAGVHARGRAGLEPAHGKSESLAAFRERSRRGKAVGAGIAQHLAHDRPPAQVGAGREDRGLTRPHRARRRHDGADRAARIQLDGDDLRLLDAQMRLRLQRVLHDLLIAPPVRLRAQGVDGGTLAAVEHPVLDAGLIRRARHLAAEGVKLAHEMALARAADGGVAGHVPHGVQIDRKAHGVEPQPRGGQRRLDAGVSRADHGDVARSRVVSHGVSPRNDCVKQYFNMNRQKMQAMKDGRQIAAPTVCGNPI